MNGGGGNTPPAQNYLAYSGKKAHTAKRCVPFLGGGQRPLQNRFGLCQILTVPLPVLWVRVVYFYSGDAPHAARATKGNAFMLNDEPVDILVVEDGESERNSIVEALQAALPDICIVAVHDGTAALDFLFARGGWADRAGEDPPRLILLDLSLPGTDGFSVLCQIRSLDADNALTLTPVVIFSDSQNPDDITKSYRCGANSYIMKPLSFPDFQAMVKSIGQYWMTHNRSSQ